MAKEKPQFGGVFAQAAQVQQDVDKAIKSGEIFDIPLDKIGKPKFHDRIAFSIESIERLANDIRSIGLTNPIVVRRIDNDAYERIAGFRRMKAVELLGYTTIKAVIVDVDESVASLMMLSENIHREDLNAYDEITAIIQYLSNAVGLTFDNTISLIQRIANFRGGRVKEFSALDHEKMARLEAGLAKIGKYNFNGLKDKLSVLNMSKAIIDALQGRQIEYSNARLLHKLKGHEDTQKRLLDKAIAEQLSYDALTVLVENELAILNANKKPSKAKPSYIGLEKGIKSRYKELSPEKKKELDRLVIKINCILVQEAQGDV